MERKKKSYLLCSTLLGSLLFTSGCSKNTNTLSVKDIVYNIVPSDEIVKVEEIPSDVKVEGKTLKDVKIILNLEKFSKSIIYEKSLETATYLLSGIDLTLDNEFNNYTILINSSKLDVYGNTQKVKVLEININKDTLDKINFENFDYLNLDKVADVKKFNYLIEDDENIK